MATILERLGIQKRARVGKFDSQTIGAELGVYGMTASGITVSEQGALAISTVYACIYRIASTVSSLSLNIYLRVGNRVTLAESHPAYDLVKYEPNSYQTAMEFWERLYSSALMYGVGYAMITRDNSGRPVALDLLDYYDVEPKLVGNEKVYSVQGVGVVRPENMLELANIMRMSPLRLHRENLGLTKAAQDFGGGLAALGFEPRVQSGGIGCDGAGRLTPDLDVVPPIGVADRRQNIEIGVPIVRHEDQAWHPGQMRGLPVIHRRKQDCALIDLHRKPCIA